MNNIHDYIYFQLGNCFVDMIRNINGYDILNDRAFELSPSVLTEKLIQMKDMKLLIKITQTTYRNIYDEFKFIVISDFNICSHEELDKFKQKYPEYFI